MAMISYAQNYEDVMLWRALNHLENGFYIDIGAAWPELDNVTAHFYASGWKGINVEPNPDLFAQLEASRPLDINLNCAVSSQPGQAIIHLNVEPGLSTLDSAIAEKHEKGHGYHTARKLNVSVMNLNSIYEKYVDDQQAVHFLKVDVEGAEKAVLEGNSWDKNRPWILLVESTLPMSQASNHENWEGIVLNSGYCFAYFDGLNRFYIAEEKWNDLSSFFSTPPNVFDEFSLSTEILLLQKVNDLKDKLELAKLKLDDTYNGFKELENREKIIVEEANKVDARAKVVEGEAAKVEARAKVVEDEAAKVEARAKVVEDESAKVEARAKVVEDEAAKVEARAKVVEDEAAKVEARAKVVEGEAAKLEVRASMYVRKISEKR